MTVQPLKTDTNNVALVSAQLATLPQLAAGISASAQPHGTMRVTQDPTSIFYDSFSGSVLDTTDRWATTGTAPTQTNGVLTLPAGTASATSILTSKPVIPLTSTQYVLPAFALRFEAAVGTGVGRFWGMGTAPSTPSITSLAQEGVGFELDSATGALQAVTYTGGVKTIIAALTRPTDGLLHRYSLQYRNSRTYWFIDDLNVYAATATFLNTAIQDLPIQVSSVSGATLTNAPTLLITAIGVADLNRQATQLSDGLFPWRKTTVKAASVPAAATDGALIVGLHPSSPLPAGTNIIGTVGVNNFPASQAVTGTGTVATPATGVVTVQGIAGGAAQPVTGTFFQATQPVSIATNTPDVTDRAARLLGVTTIAAGAAAIGTVGVTALPALSAGANIVGKVGIDQTTPGTTNAVAVTTLPALPTGTNAIGTVAVTALPALPTGANSIGTVGVTALPTLPAGTNTIGAANINTANASATTALHTANATTGLTVGANLPITGYGTGLLKVTGTFVASFAFKVSQDAGTSWDAIAATQVGAGDIFTTAALPGSYRLTVTGFDLLRVEVTLTSGSITINGRASNAVNASKIVKLASGNNIIGQVKEYRAANSAVSRVPSLATTATLLAANINRSGAMIYNESTAVLYLKLGATASLTSYTLQVLAGAYYEVPAYYAGIIDGIWATAQGAAQVTEVS